MSENVADCRWMRFGVVILAFWPSLIARGYDYGGGSGAPEDPYLIYTPEQMNAIGLHEDDWGQRFRLMADIDLGSYSGGQFNTIGCFRGVFDGNGCAISNFTYASASRAYVGLFEWLGDDQAQIKNVILIDPVVDAEFGDHVGALVGYVGKGTVADCHVIGGTVFADKAVGGVAGSNMGGVIANCSATSEVTGRESVGGLVGMNRGKRIANSRASGSVVGDDNIGGLVGASYGTITNCYADSQVTGREEVGGLVGHHGLLAKCGSLRISMPGTVSCCYSVGPVTGRTAVGGLVGANHCGDVDDCFWDVQTTGHGKTCGHQGDDDSLGTDDGGRMTDQMQTASTFLEADWDFVDETENGTDDIWWIDEAQDYPRLWWELMPES
ncbi:MAG: hypothetical protein JSW27_00530 [Phycisphaerales bacterium]|nr:MAG: hypothetical protein JSW27_00530 [Phycisphaerales bacterium]